MVKTGFLVFVLLLSAASLLFGQEPITLDSPSEQSTSLWMFQFSSDAKTVAGYTSDQNLLSWDIASRKLLSSQPAKTEKATFDNQGRLLSFVRSEKGTRVIDVARNQEVVFLDGAYLYSMDKFALSSDAKTLALEDRGLVRLWDLTTGKERVSLKRPALEGDSAAVDYVNELRFSADGQTLAGLSKSIELWSLSTGKHSRTIGIKAGLARMNFTPDGKMICVSGFDNIKPSFVKCFGVLSGREVLSVPADPSAPFAFSPDGKLLAVLRQDQAIFLINMTTRKETKVPVSVDKNSMNQMSFSPDGKLLGATSNVGLVLVDPAAGKELFILASGTNKQS